MFFFKFLKYQYIGLEQWGKKIRLCPSEGQNLVGKHGEKPGQSSASGGRPGFRSLVCNLLSGCCVTLSN